jgi:hypothetical protein
MAVWQPRLFRWYAPISDPVTDKVTNAIKNSGLKFDLFYTKTTKGEDTMATEPSKLKTVADIPPGSRYRTSWTHDSGG